MSLKPKRPGLMALEGLEDTTGADESQKTGEETQGTALGDDPTAGTTINEEAKPTPDGTGSGEAGGETGVVETDNKGVTNTPELEGKVVARDANSAVAQGDAIAIIDVNSSGAEPKGEIAQEGWKGATMGFAAGFLGLVIPGAQVGVGAVASNQAKRLKAEIEAVAKELEAAAVDQGEALVKAGKLSAEDVKKNVKIGMKGVLTGALLGGLFGAIYSSIKGHHIEELMHELKDKCKQLDEVVKKEAARQGIATEELSENVKALAALNVAQEGWKGATLGFAAGFLGIIPGFNIGAGAAANNQAKRLKAEIEEVAKELEIAAYDQGQKLVREGKLTADDVKKNVKVGIKGIIGGAILGGLFGPIYGAIKGHEIEDLMAELKSKSKQLDNILKRDAARQGIAVEGLEVLRDEDIGVLTPTEGTDGPGTNAEAPVTETPPADAGTVIETDGVIVGDEVADAMVDLDEKVAGVNELGDSISEATAVVETVEGINEQLETAAAEDGPGIAPAEAEAIRVAVEHMKQAVGYSGKDVFPAMEAFGGTTTKRQGARLALESNQRFIANLKKGLKFAQEGLEAKVDDAWDAYWTSEEKLAERVSSLKGILSKATFGDKALSNPTWGKSINPGDQPFIKGDEVAATVTKLSEVVASSKLAEILDGVAAGAAEPAAEGGEACPGLKAAVESTGALVTQVESDFPSEGKSETDFAPLDQDGATKLLDAAEALLKSDDVKAALTKLADVLESKEDCKDAYDVASQVLQLQRVKLRVISSALSYIAASAGESAEAAPPAADAAPATPAAADAAKEGEDLAAKEQKEAERGGKAD